MSSILIVIDHYNLDLDALVKNNTILSADDTYKEVTTIDVFLNYLISDPFELDYKLNKIYTIIREKCEYQVSINVFFKHENLKLDKILAYPYTKTFLSENTSLSIPHSPYKEYVNKTKINYQQEISSSTKFYNAKCFDISAVGGTFDHIHDGHKILLSISIFLTKVKLIIGLTAEKLLVNKKFKDQLESFEVRKNNVLKFVNYVDKALVFDILPINDVCGPTGYEPNIQALIVSKETEAGGQTINKVRKEKALRELDVFVVDILGGNEKLSSTTLRQLQYEKLNKL